MFLDAPAVEGERQVDPSVSRSPQYSVDVVFIELQLIYLKAYMDNSKCIIRRKVDHNSVLPDYSPQIDDAITAKQSWSWKGTQEMKITM